MESNDLDFATENQGLMVLMTSYMQAGNEEDWDHGNTGVR